MDAEAIIQWVNRAFRHGGLPTDNPPASGQSAQAGGHADSTHQISLF